MGRYVVHGWTRREARGFAAVVAALPAGQTQPVARIERIARTESEAMMMLVLLAGSLARKLKRRGDEVGGISIRESPPKGVPA